MSDLASLVRNIPDFPLPGIQYKDITTLIGNGPAFQEVINRFVERYRGRDIQAVVGIESRGFIFGAPLAYHLGVGLVPIRKPGKLPAETMSIEYQLEYGQGRLEIHRDALEPGMRVLVVDDLLATGGTISAASKLIEQCGAQIDELAFVIELNFLNGRDRLNGYSIFSLIQY